MIESVPELHSDEHQVKPAMAYVSNTTEIGTVYSKAELQALRQCCDKHGLLLFLDGARLGSALACGDMDLPDYAALADVFYIGGTKNGALFGEALVFAKAREDFRWHMKRRGAMLAKGRLLGVQFQALLEDGRNLPGRRPPRQRPGPPPPGRRGRPGIPPPGGIPLQPAVPGPAQRGHRETPGQGL